MGRETSWFIFRGGGFAERKNKSKKKRKKTLETKEPCKSKASHSKFFSWVIQELEKAQFCCDSRTICSKRTSSVPLVNVQFHSFFSFLFFFLFFFIMEFGKKKGVDFKTSAMKIDDHEYMLSIWDTGEKCKFFLFVCFGQITFSFFFFFTQVAFRQLDKKNSAL